MRRRAVLLVVLAVVAVVTVVLLGRGPWLAPPPALPPLPAGLERADPAVAQLIERAYERLEGDRGDAARWLDLAMVYDANELDVPALACYEGAVAMGAADPRALYHLAVVRMRLGRVDEATEAMRRAAEAAPDFAPATWRLGLYLLDLGRLDEADAAFRRSTEIDPQDAGGWLGMARVQLERREPAQAVALLERLIASSVAGANTAYAHHLLSIAYRRLGRDTEADAAALRGDAGEAVWGDAWRSDLARYRTGRRIEIREAREQLESGRIAEALERLEALQTRWPEDTTVLVNLAIALRKSNLVTESIETLERVLELKPDYYPAHLQIAVSYVQQSRQAGAAAAQLRRAAMAHAGRALELNPTYASAHGLRGDAHLLDGEFEPALVAYREASRCDPLDAQWPYRAGLVLLRQQRWEEAREGLARATALGSESSEAYRGLALACIMTGRLDEAERALASGDRLSPGDPAIGQMRERLREARLSEGAGT